MKVRDSIMSPTYKGVEIHEIDCNALTAEKG